jgi:spectinomycin phosphotransferase/16S rRNA (guanine(1405)-N(7))-methyltransferase
MVRDVHAAPSQVVARAMADDHGVPHRDVLELALGGAAPAGTGPYAQRSADLIADHADAVRGLLTRYDRLVAGADHDRAVLTHGEPHAGNTMRTPAGWRLIDWETALVAPPERDLWHLGPQMQHAYATATGVAVLPEMLELYRLRWEIADLAVGVDRFALPHDGNADDDASWAIVERIVTGLDLA